MEVWGSQYQSHEHSISVCSPPSKKKPKHGSLLFGFTASGQVSEKFITRRRRSCCCCSFGFKSTKRATITGIDSYGHIVELNLVERENEEEEITKKNVRKRASE